jgi:hypothetical protein
MSASQINITIIINKNQRWFKKLIWNENTINWTILSKWNSLIDKEI